MKPLFRLFIFCTAGLFIFLSSCEPKKKEISGTTIDSLQQVMLNLQDSIHANWNTMIADDNQKIADAKRLLEEISYTNVYDQGRYDSLQNNLSQLLVMRYDSISMSNSALIDQYDSAANKVIGEIIALATNHPDYQSYPLMEELVKDIQDANGRVLRHRVNYDYTAKAYNLFLEENKEILKEIDSLKDLEKKPLFELSS